LDREDDLGFAWSDLYVKNAERLLFRGAPLLDKGKPNPCANTRL
jgi:hypothetical protein